MSLPEPVEEEALAAKLAFAADVGEEEEAPAPVENGGASTTAQNGSGNEQDFDDEEDIREGETAEEALQRRIEEGKIGKGKTLRRWKDTEEKQRRVETWRHQSKVQRYGQIYEEVRALRKETRHSVQDLRERFKEKGVIQNKDQFIVKLIAQERNEQEGKVAAIKSLQQWRLTDVELHNFINRCHKKGIAGKLDLAMQWAVEQEEAGGEVNFKEGLAFYSSIGILQPRSSAHTQQQWREWREWEDAMTCALEKHKSRGADVTKAADATGPEGSLSNEDSTVCNSPWSSERGGGGSVAGFGGGLRASSHHGDGHGRFRSRSGTAPENGTAPEQALKDGLGMSGLGARGRTPSNGDSRNDPDRSLSWRSYSPPSVLLRHKRGSADGGTRKKTAAPGFAQPVGASPAEGGAAASGIGKPPPSPGGTEPSDGGGVGGVSGKLGESVVRSSGGYLPPRHPLAALQLSPASHAGASGSESGETGAGRDSAAETGAEAEVEAEAEAEAEAPTLDAVPTRADLKGRAAARTAKKGPAADTPEKPPLLQPGDTGEGPAPTEGEGGGGVGGKSTKRASRRLRYSDGGLEPGGGRDGGGGGSRGEGRQRSVSGVLSGLADWLMPGMENRRSAPEKTELLMEVYPSAPRSPEARPTVTQSAPSTPRGRRRPSSVLRDGGWFYNGDSDYSSEEEMDGSYESEDEGFWADAGTTKPPKKIGGGGGNSILSRLKKLFT
eukprot:g8441.t1